MSAKKITFLRPLTTHKHTNLALVAMITHLVVQSSTLTLIHNFVHRHLNNTRYKKAHSTNWEAIFGNNG